MAVTHTPHLHLSAWAGPRLAPQTCARVRLSGRSAPHSMWMHSSIATPPNTKRSTPSHACHPVTQDSLALQLMHCMRAQLGAAPTRGSPAAVGPGECAAHRCRPYDAQSTRGASLFGHTAPTHGRGFACKACTAHACHHRAGRCCCLHTQPHWVHASICQCCHAEARG